MDGCGSYSIRWLLAAAQRTGRHFVWRHSSHATHAASLAGRLRILVWAFADVRLTLSQSSRETVGYHATDNIKCKAISFSPPTGSGSRNIERLDPIVLDILQNRIRS